MIKRDEPFLGELWINCYDNGIGSVHEDEAGAKAMVRETGWVIHVISYARFSELLDVLKICREERDLAENRETRLAVEKVQLRAAVSNAEKERARLMASNRDFLQALKIIGKSAPNLASGIAREVIKKHEQGANDGAR